MALKRECDRCGDQWLPVVSYDNKDVDLTTVQVQPGNAANYSKDLCTNCARKLVEFFNQPRTAERKG